MNSFNAEPKALGFTLSRDEIEKISQVTKSTDGRSVFLTVEGPELDKVKEDLFTLLACSVFQWDGKSLIHFTARVI